MASRLGCLLVCLLVFARAERMRAQEGTRISGKVEDTTGKPIQGAQIEFWSGEGLAVSSSDEEGEFRIVLAGAGGTLVVNFPGFATVTREILAQSSAEDLRVILAPVASLQRIEVKGNETEPIPAVPTSQHEISDQAIHRSGCLAIDDVLRQVPGFSTYRRLNSFLANPPSQGVSLRGVGASATSRSLVLLDGIPLNDAFGGWVYWARIPREAIESIEVYNGGVSDLYGGGAMGGVVNVQTRRSEVAFGPGELSYGSMNTPHVSFAAGAPLGRWSISGAGQAYQTQGYIPVSEDQRGKVDTNLTSGSLSGFLEVSRNIGERGHIFVRGNAIGEKRNIPANK